MSRTLQAVLLAAGASTRMKTKKSKLEQEILGRPFLAWALDQASWLSKDLIVVVGHHREAIETLSEKFKPEECKISFAHQKEQKGTADAVKVALPFLGNDDVMILGADTALLEAETAKRWLESYRSSNAALSFLTFEVSGNHAYGRVRRDSAGKPVAIVESKDATSTDLTIKEVNAGFYLLRADILREGLSTIRTDNKAGEFYLTDLVNYCHSKGLGVQAFQISPEEAFGANTLEELALVESVLQRRINSYWMGQGVRLINPETIRIEPTVDLAPNVVIHPGVQLLGDSELHEGCEVGSYSIVKDSLLEKEAKVHSHSVLDQAHVGKNADAGPFARLRPGARLEENVHVGNFVEVKKSTLKKGAKAGHLTYLGDATIGENANVGAGTITCNYDGFFKYETHVGRDVFIGSNTSLVAPVKIGEGALIGAGSVISEEVESHAIAVTRAPQMNRPEAAKRFREKRSAKKGNK